MSQVKLLYQLFQFLLLVLFGEVGHFQYRQDIILHTHLAEYTCFLWQIANTQLRTLVHGHTCNIQIIEEYLSIIGSNQSCGHVKGGRFTSTIRTQQAHNLPLL